MKKLITIISCVALITLLNGCGDSVDEPAPTNEAAPAGQEEQADTTAPVEPEPETQESPLAAEPVEEEPAEEPEVVEAVTEEPTPAAKAEMPAEDESFSFTNSDAQKLKPKIKRVAETKWKENEEKRIVAEKEAFEAAEEAAIIAEEEAAKQAETDAAKKAEDEKTPPIEAPTEDDGETKNPTR